MEVLQLRQWRRASWSGRTWVARLLLLGAATTAVADQSGFSAGPAAVRTGDKTLITFAVSTTTDVEVAILDAQGNVIRHLAAGMLGGAQAPPAPLQAGLAQSLEWDGADDFGKPAPRDAGAAVRVRTGLGVKFGRFIADDPYTFGAPTDVVADDEGTLYVMGFDANRNQCFRTIRAFDAKGHYLRTVMPFPADLPPDGMKDVARWDELRKAFHPRNLSSVNPEFYARNLTFVAASRRGGMVLTDGARLYALDTRGAVNGAAFAAATLWNKELLPWGTLPNTGGGPLCAAVSPDGQYLYVAGPFSRTTQYGHKYDPRLPPGCIYRTNLDPTGILTPFATIPVDHVDGNGGAWRKHNAFYNDRVAEGPIHGLAVDAKGNLYAADRQNQRIVVFDGQGKEIAESMVRCPHQIAIHPVSGEVYVLTRFQAGHGVFQLALLRFKEIRKDAVPAATYTFPDHKRGNQKMALGVAGGKTTVHIVGIGEGLFAVEDCGAEFTPVELAFKPQPEMLDVYNRMEVDPVREEVYLSNGDAAFARYNGLTGEGGLLKKDGKPFAATDLAVGYDGLLYFQTGGGFSGPLERFTRDLAPAPYPSGTHVLSKYIYGRYGVGNCEKGIGAGPDGKVYVAWMFGGWVKYAVSAWGADGKPINGNYTEIFKGSPSKSDPAQLSGGHHSSGVPAELLRAVIGPIPQANGGVRVDLQGNIYVGMTVDAAHASGFPGFEKDDAFKHCTGSIVKFGPSGGRVEGSESMMTGGQCEGALCIYHGLAPLSRPALGTTCCVCRVPRFGVDRYGRLAVPNATGNFVLLLDNAGNAILEAGSYGNFDSMYSNPHTQGQPPTATTPEVPLAWPNCAQLTDRSLYVLDVYNRRVVRADLTWQAEATVRVN